MQTRLYVLNFTKEKNRTSLQQSCDEITSVIEEQYNTLCQYLQNQKKETLAELNTIHSTLKSKLACETSTCKNIYNDIKSLEKALNRKDRSEVEQFSQSLKCQQKLLEAEAFVEGVSSQEICVSFDCDRKMDEFLSIRKTFGDLKADVPRHSHIYTVDNFYTRPVSSNDDKTGCNITDICQLPSGDIVLSDLANNCLKHFDEELTTLFRKLNVSGMPYGLAVVSDFEIVAIVNTNNSSEVLFITIKQRQMKLKRKIKINEHCFGISVKEEFLYLRSNTGILVYTMAGKFESQFWTGKSPVGYLARSDDGEKVYVCNPSALVTLNKYGNEISMLEDCDLFMPWGMCVAPNGNVFICELVNHNVVQVDPSGKEILAILSTEYGLHMPQSVCFSKIRSRLYVGQNGNSVHVFEMK